MRNVAKAPKPKRRPNNDGMEPRLRSDGRFDTKVSLGFRSDGKADRRTIYGHTAEEVLKKKHDLLSRYGRNLINEPDKITFGEWLDRWLEMLEPHIAESTKLQYTHRLAAYIPDTIKRLKLQAVKRADMIVLEAHIARLGLAFETRSTTMQHIRAALDMALEMEVIAVNPAYRVKVKASVADRAKRADPVKKALTDSEMDAFLNAAEGEPLFPLFYAMFSLGLRVGEALGLRWQDVNSNDLEVSINQQVKLIGTKLEAGALKTLRSRRTIPMSQDLSAVLESRRWVQDAERDVMKSVWPETDLIFTTALGTPIDRHNVNRTIARIVNKANAEGFAISIEADQVPVTRDKTHDFTIKTDDLARGLGVTGNTVRVLRRERTSLKKDIHFLETEKRNGGHAMIVWTRAGATQATKILKTERAKAFQAALEDYALPAKTKISVRAFTSHACRHTNLTGLLRDRTPVEVVAALAGHSSPVVTLTRYRTVFEDEKRAAVTSLEARRKKFNDAKKT
jgi:integrase